MILVIEHSDQAGAGRLVPILTRYAHRLRFVRPHLGDALPVDLDDVDGVISCGGPQSANDDDPALAAEMALLRTAHESGRAVLGICLGSQLLAKALGGTVGPLPGGAPEIGWHEVRLSPIGREDPLFAGIGWTTRQLHWHGEMVTKAPPGARVLANSEACAIQAWGVGLRAYGIQYHPEWTESELERTIAADRGDLARAGLAASAIREQSLLEWPTSARLAERLFESLALLVMPVDRRLPHLVRQ